MLSAEQCQHLQTTLDELAIQALVAWIDAKTLAEGTRRVEARDLVGQLWIIMAEAKGAAAVLREEGVPQ